MQADGVSVWAIVVAYEAPDTVAACLAGLAAQTTPVDRVVVVDNGREASAVGGPTVEVVRPGANLGPAGGFALGLDRFLASDADFAWLMDDDIVPSADTLGHLLAVLRDRPPGIAFPLVARAGSAPVRSLPAWAGVLLPRAVVSAVGVPDASLFFWVEDTEYLQWRIPRAGFAHYDAHAAVVHDHRIRREAHLPPWGYYYRARNTVHYRLRVQRGRRVHRVVVVLARLAVRAAREPERRAKLVMVGRGVSDGLRGRLGPTVLPPSQPAVEAARRPSTSEGS